MIEIIDLGGNGMGVGFMNQANVSGSLSAVGASSPAHVRGMFNVGLNGTFVATLELQRSLDNGVTWNDLTAMGFETPFTGPCQEIYDEPENQAMYRWNCTAYTSGTINYRISQ